MFNRHSIALLKVCVFALFLSPTIAPLARATCGDWLQHRIKGNSLAAVGWMSDMRGDQPHSTSEVEPRNSHRPPVQIPCHGPHCSESPRQPLIPVPVSVPAHSEHATLAPAATTGPTSTQIGYFSEFAVRSAKGHLRRPEHPPRA